MATVQKVNLTHSELEQNRIDTLGYAVINERGYLKDLKDFDLTKGALVDEFINVGFVKVGHTRNNGKTFGVTNLGRGYFNEIGWGEKLKRFVPQVKNSEPKNILQKLVSKVIK